MVFLLLMITETKVKSEDSEALDGGTSRLSSQREYGKIKMKPSIFVSCDYNQNHGRQ